MSWKNLVTDGKLRPHRTSPKEISELRELVARDLADAAIGSLSSDRRFAIAYNAALQIATMSLACAGYRVSRGAGHHQNTFEAARLALGRSAQQLLDYFEVCRRKRNAIDYTRSSVASESEAEELVEKADDFRVLVENWIALNHRHLAR